MKYLFALLLTCAAASKSGDSLYLIAGIIELILIFSISHTILGKGKFGYVLNSILMLLYNVQMIVLIFGSSYITMVMLTNIASIKALSGRAETYITSAVLAVIFSFLPTKKREWNKKKELLLLSTLFVGILFFIGDGSKHFPVYGYVNLAIQHHENTKATQAVNQIINASAEETEYIKNEFYQDSIDDYKAKDDFLGENPNIILIFTEGLSQNVVTDEREIMPNVAKLQSESVNFVNYYNHTFATYRGLNGQLYSGHQLDDIEANPLISIQDILSECGYQTAFINTEPQNRDFTDYLTDMGFDELIEDTAYECNGLADSITDEDAYEILYDSAVKMAQSGQPYFLAIYTFGTHTSFDSTGEVYGDGTNPVLNRFYNVDYQFGKFWEKFKNSELFDNTVLVFTADHVTYKDDPYVAAFSEYTRVHTCFDEIPLSIYYKGITPETIDVNGRNSLGLAPTVLDYLDISAPNYFLGTSLFAKEAGSMLETSFYDSCTYYSSENDEIKIIEGSTLEEFKSIINDYYITKSSCGKREK